MIYKHVLYSFETQPLVHGGEQDPVFLLKQTVEPRLPFYFKANG